LQKLQLRMNAAKTANRSSPFFFRVFSVQIIDQSNSTISAHSRATPTLAVTTSIGVAAANGTLDFKTLVQHADEALYAAKRAVRNRVVTANTARLAR
jgi:diguanylate cyclase (GGDEF)-like protein